MRIISPHYVSKLKMHIDSKGLRPAPFPGVDPIRWKIWFRDSIKGKTWNYLGKPNVAIAKIVMEFASNRQGHLHIQEFDRKNLIGVVNLFTPCAILTNDLSIKLCQYYRPYLARCPLVWMNKGTQRAKLKFENKTRVLYTYDTFDRDLRDYKTWLQQNQNAPFKPLISTTYKNYRLNNPPW